MISGLYKNTHGARAHEIESADALITVEDGRVVLMASASAMLADFERQAKAIKAKQDELKKRILEEMESRNILQIDTDDVTITYIAPTNRETFDSKAFRADNPALYDEYVRIGAVAPSVRIKVKGE